MKRKFCYLLSHDKKSIMWGRELKKYGYKPEYVRFLSLLIKLTVRYASPQYIIIRYLNDRKSFIATLKQAIKIFLILSLGCCLVRCKIIWVCHNIDKETVQNWPTLMQAKRKWISRFAKQILVLDPLLVPYAEKHLKHAPPDKISAISFGFIENPVAFQSSKARRTLTDRELVMLRRRVADKHSVPTNKTLLGLCVGSFGEKSIHFTYANWLLQHAGCAVGLLVAGDTKSATNEQVAVLDQLRKRQDALVIDEPIIVDENELRPYYDFIYRSLSDISVPLTSYIAASVNKPIVTLDSGFLPVLVAKYQLGVVIRTDSSEDVGRALSTISEFPRPSGRGEFFRQRSWGSLAEVLEN